MPPSQGYKAAVAAVADDAVLPAGIAGDAPAAEGAADGVVPAPSLLGALGLALGLPGWWRGAGRRKEEESRRLGLRR
jgi:hypothetical protein